MSEPAEKPDHHRELARAAVAAYLLRERASARALLKAEKRAFLKLRATSRAVAARAIAQVASTDDRVAPRHAMVVVRHTVPVLLHAIELDLIEVRRDAREAARGDAERRPEATHEDKAAAHTSAGAYAAAWGAAAMAAALGARDGESIAPRFGALRQEHRLARTAATETARAFNDEREEMYDEAPDDGTRFKVWSAVLDRVTCHHCFRRDGEVIGVRESFGATPPLHPNCRCVIELVVVPSPKRLTDIAFDYALFKEEMADVIREKRDVSDRHAARFTRESTTARRSPSTLTKKFRDEAYARRP